MFPSIINTFSHGKRELHFSRIFSDTCWKLLDRLLFEMVTENYCGHLDINLISLVLKTHILIHALWKRHYSQLNCVVTFPYDNLCPLNMGKQSN